MSHEHTHHRKKHDKYNVGGAEIASTGKCKYGKTKVQKGKMCNCGKYKYGKIKYDCARAENASTEKASTSEHDQYYSTYSVLYHLVGRLEFRSKG